MSDAHTLVLEPDLLDALRNAFEPDELAKALIEFVQAASMLGIDVRAMARAVAQALVPEQLSEAERRFASLEAMREEEDPISVLYREHRAALRRGDLPRAEQLFAQLRKLQEAEANEYDRRFRERMPFQPGELDATLARAEALVRSKE